MWKTLKKDAPIGASSLSPKATKTLTGFNGGPSGTRTPDQPVMSRLL